MKVEKVSNWLSKSLFQPQNLGNPITAEIIAYSESKGEKGINRRLLLKHANKKQYQCDVFGDTFNQLIDDLGDDTDKWIGRQVQVMLVMKGEQEIKQFKVLP